MAVDRRVLQSPAMQALVEEMEWMLARCTQQLRAERLAARAREKRHLRRARKQELRSRCKRTMQQLNRSSLRCNCHDFACWEYLWSATLRSPQLFARRVIICLFASFPGRSGNHTSAKISSARTADGASMRCLLTTAKSLATNTTIYLWTATTRRGATGRCHIGDCTGWADMGPRTS